MRRTILAIALLAPSLAVAAPRPSTTAMSCGAAHALVTHRGAIVLGTGGDTYDRFVANRSLCEIEQVIQPAFVPTASNPQCFIGYRCIEPRFNRF